MCVYDGEYVLCACEYVCGLHYVRDVQGIIMLYCLGRPFHTRGGSGNLLWCPR